MSSRRRGGRRGLAVSVVVGVLVVILVAMLSGSFTNGGPSQPSDTPADVDPTESDEPVDRNESAGTPRVRSAPKALVIPAIAVHSKLLKLGTTRHDTVRQPSVPTKAGWFKRSAVPGYPGVSVIVGYIRKSENQPGVFSRLSRLKQGHRISVRRADGAVAVFRVNEIAKYPKGKFPTSKVYARTAEPELRVITGGGTLSPEDPPGNVVVYASLRATQ